MAPRAAKFGEMMQNNGYCAIQSHSRSFKVTFQYQSYILVANAALNYVARPKNGPSRQRCLLWFN